MTRSFVVPIPAGPYGSRAIAAAASVLLACAATCAEPSDRRAFIRRHQCEIAARLNAIHRRGPVTTSRDRFIVVALRGRPQHYVQCIFQDLDAAMYCEASSGAYRHGADAAMRLEQSPESVAALLALGYRQKSPRENFSREIRLGDPPEVGVAADIMLSALADAHGARPDTAIEINAPRGGMSGQGCGTPGS